MTPSPTKLVLVVLILLGLQATVCRFTIDHYGIDLIDDGSLNGATVAGTTRAPAAAITAWNAQVGSGQEWLNKQGHYKVAQLLEHPSLN